MRRSQPPAAICVAEASESQSQSLGEALQKRLLARPSPRRLISRNLRDSDLLSFSFGLYSNN